MSSLKCYSGPVETKVDRPVVSIRRLELQDVVPCVLLVQAMHAESKYAYIPFEDDALVTSIKAAMAEDSQIFLATLDEQIIGILWLQKGYQVFNATTAEASDVLFYVIPKHRNINIVRQLIKAGEQWCAENCIHTLTLGVTASYDYASVIKVYEHFNYKLWGAAVRKELL